MEVGEIPRVFMYKGEELSDPDHGLAPSRVLEHYEGQFPEFMNATVDGGEYKDGKLIYTVKTVIGTKG